MALDWLAGKGHILTIKGPDEGYERRTPMAPVTTDMLVTVMKRERMLSRVVVAVLLTLLATSVGLLLAAL